jgi:hypothetical protein
MAGAMRKMAVYLGLVEDASYEDYDEYDDYEEPARESPQRAAYQRASSRSDHQARFRGRSGPVVSGGGTPGDGGPEPHRSHPSPLVQRRASHW